MSDDDVRRTLLLLRHARTEDSRPGGHDRERRLTEKGMEQARDVGEYLRAQGITVDHVLCSPALRARQTLEGLGLDVETEVVERLYEAGGESIVELVRELPDVAVALVVGHAPGVPAALDDLADPESSTTEAVTAVEGRFPAGTLAVLEVRGPWSDLSDVRLTAVRLP